MPGDVRGLDQVLEHVLPVRGAVAQPAEQRDQLRVDVGDARPRPARPRPPAGTAARPRAWRCSKTSSMRCGWIRPSRTSFSSVSRPISRRTGSKQDSSTASGVSSMIRLTPVTDSNARMLRPSRPMIRPFISSPGRCSTLTTLSAVCSLATRWIASTTMCRARCSAGRPGVGLDVADQQRGLALGLPLDRLDQLGAGRLGGEAGDPLQLAPALPPRPRRARPPARRARPRGRPARRSRWRAAAPARRAARPPRLCSRSRSSIRAARRSTSAACSLAAAASSATSRSPLRRAAARTCSASCSACRWARSSSGVRLGRGRRRGPGAPPPGRRAASALAAAASARAAAAADLATSTVEVASSAAVRRAASDCS